MAEQFTNVSSIAADTNLIHHSMLATMQSVTFSERSSTPQHQPVEGGWLQESAVEKYIDSGAYGDAGMGKW